MIHCLAFCTFPRVTKYARPCIKPISGITFTLAVLTNYARCNFFILLRMTTDLVTFLIFYMTKITWSVVMRQV